MQCVFANKIIIKVYRMDLKIIALILACIPISIAHQDETGSILNLGSFELSIKEEIGNILKGIFENEAKNIFTKKNKLHSLVIDKITEEHDADLAKINSKSTDLESLIKNSDAQITKAKLNYTKHLALNTHRYRLLYNYTNNMLKLKLYNRLKNEGTMQIKEFGKLLRKSINTCVDTKTKLDKITETAVSSYETNVAKYFKSMQGESPEGRPANELLLADLIEQCNNLLSNQKNQMFQELIQKIKKYVEKIDIEVISKQLKNDKVNNKRRDFTWVCLKVRVCKPYPGFSNYLADIINFIIKLPDYKYKKIVTTLLEILKNMPHLIDDFIDKNNSEKIFAMMDASFKPIKSKRFFRNVSEAIINKNSYVYDQDYVALSKIILIEMLDKVFYKVEDILRIEFENTIDTLKTWQSGEVHYVDIDTHGVLLNYVENMMKQCHAAWKIGYKTEVNTLIELILYGEAKNQTLAQSILLNGSSYVNKMNSVL